MSAWAFCSGVVRRNSWWDYIVFKKVQNMLGGRVRFIISGSAPISVRVLDFLRAAFGCTVSQDRILAISDLVCHQVMEGYGQTECNAAATVTVPGETEPGHVGPPIPSVRIKLADVPDMNYFAANSVGEVAITNLFAYV